MVYKIIHKANGEIEKYKARLVAKDFMQVEGEDFRDLCSKVAFNMGKHKTFPPWESCIWPIDYIKNTHLSYSLHTKFFIHFHHHSLFHALH